MYEFYFSVDDEQSTSDVYVQSGGIVWEKIFLLKKTVYDYD